MVAMNKRSVGSGGGGMLTSLSRQFNPLSIALSIILAVLIMIMINDNAFGSMYVSSSTNDRQDRLVNTVIINIDY